MTNKESARWLRDMLQNFDLPMEQYQIALNNGIKELEQEPKTGHWIYIRNSEVNGLKIVKCSECGKEYDPHSSQFIKYCNECGARMFEPQEGSDKECTKKI